MFDRSNRLRAIFEHVPLSHEGIGWLTLTVAMIATGLLKSINLITLLGCALLGVLAINLWLARRQVRGVKALREIPDVVVAGEPFAWTIRVSQKSPAARSGVEILDSAPGHRLEWLADLAAVDSQTLERTVRADERGVFPLPTVRVRSGHPFGLAEFEQRQNDGAMLVVAPPIGRLHRGVLRRWLASRQPVSGAVRSRPFRRPTGQSEFHGLRPFRPGDSPRLIHWRTSARLGELMVREFEEFPNDDLALIVDLTAESASPRFEAMLSLAATIVWEWCRQKGDNLTVILAGERIEERTMTTGGPLRSEALRMLAGARPAGRVDEEDLSRSVVTARKSPTAHLLLSVGASRLLGLVSSAQPSLVSHVDLAAGDEAAFFEPACKTWLPSSTGTD